MQVFNIGKYARTFATPDNATHSIYGGKGMSEAGIDRILSAYLIINW